jgi:hypothetical protein
MQDVLIAEVDCTIEKSLCQSHGVQGYFVYFFLVQYVYWFHEMYDCLFVCLSVRVGSRHLFVVTHEWTKFNCF